MIKPVAARSAALAFLIAGTTLYGGPAAHAETFDDALVSAYQTNPTLQARRVYGRAVDELVPQALSNWRPTVAITGSVYHQDRHTNPRPEIDFRRGTPARVGVTLQQNIFRGLRTVAQTESAEESVKAEQNYLKAVEQTVLLNAAQAYLTVLRDQEVLKLNQNNEEVLARQLRAVRDRFNVGEVTRTDVAQAESRLAGATADRIASEGLLETSRANYEKIIGHPPANLVTPPDYTNLPLSVEDAIHVARRGNPNVVAAEHTWRSRKADIREQQGQLLPSAYGEISYFYGNSEAVRDVESTTLRVGLNVTIPLYQSGLVYSQIRTAKHVAGQNRILVDEQRDATVEQITSAWENYQSASARVTAYESQIRAAGIALDGVRRENEVGSRTVLDVLDAEQELLIARVNLVEAQTDRSIYSYQILSALGGMTAENLRLNTPIHDPNVHIDQVRYQWFGSSDSADRDGHLGDDLDVIDNVSSRSDLLQPRVKPVNP